MDKGKIYQELLKYLDNLEIIDAHEHLDIEEEAIRNSRDLFSLFSSYSLHDLRRAGMNKQQEQFIFNKDFNIELRWKKFYPFWKVIKYTCYSKALIEGIKKIYGFSNINKNNFKDISKAINENSKKGLYRKVLIENCNIKAILNQNGRTNRDSGEKELLLVPIMYYWLGCGSMHGNWEDFQNLKYGPLLIWDYYNIRTSRDWKYGKNSINSIDDCLINQIEYLDKVKKEGAVGIKCMTYPEMNFDKNPSRRRAEELFKNFKKGKIKKLKFPNDLHLYLFDSFLKLAINRGFIISFHTGYWEDFRNLNPLNLIPFLIRFPMGKFDLYHLGYPWIRESIMLAKGFSNVYINFCWLHMISKSAAKEALNEAIETIPINKIIGFGGDCDYKSIESVYGHLKMAKNNIIDVIALKISQDWITLDGGIEIIKSILYKNPKNLYNLRIQK